MSIQVPGVDTPVEGSFITVDQSTEDRKTTEAFNKAYDTVLEAAAMEKPTLEEIVANLAKAI